MSSTKAIIRKTRIVALASAVSSLVVLPTAASAFEAFGRVLWSPVLYTDHAVDRDGNDYTYKTLDWIIDPTAVDVTGITMVLQFDASKYTFDPSLSGPLGAFSVGGGSAAATPGIGTQPLQELPSTGYQPGALLPGASLTYTVVGNTLTVNYTFPTTPVTVSGDVNNFSVDFDLIHPQRIDGSTSTVTYLTAGPGTDFTQVGDSCMTTTGPGMCGSPNLVTGMDLNLTFVPEPAAWTMLLVGFTGLGVGLRSRRRAVAATA